MSALREFTQVGARGFYQPQGQVTFEQAIAMVAAGLAHARELGLADLVINTLGLTGFAYPSVVERYQMATSVVENAGPRLRVVFVVKREFIDPQKIAKVVAQNRGLLSEVFASEAEALAWLDQRSTPPGATREASGGGTSCDD